MHRSDKVIITTAVSFAIATTSLLLRLVSRWLCRKRLEANDYLIGLAYIPKLGIDISAILLVTYGIGQHIQLLSHDDLTSYLKVVYAGSFLYAPCRALIKLSILSLYWVAFPFKHIKIAVITLTTIIVAWAIAMTLVGMLQCLPIRKAWEPMIDGTCINTYQYFYALQIPNILTDFAILVLPFKAVRDLRLDSVKTLQLSGVFAFGILTCVFGIIRLVVLVQTPTTEDLTWDQITPAMWTNLEVSVAFMVACLPIMRPLFHPRKFLQTRRESLQRQEIAEYDMDDSNSSDQNTNAGRFKRDIRDDSP